MVDLPQHRIASIGECMIEMVSQNGQDFHMNFAGDTLNTAVYFMRSLKNKASIRLDYITALGDDSFSQKMLKQWLAEGIQVSFVRRIPNKLPGLYFIKNSKEGERFFYYYRSESAARELFEGEEGNRLCESLLEFDTIYLSGITIAILQDAGRSKLIDCLQEAGQKGIVICFDTNFRQCLWPSLNAARDIIDKILSVTTIGLPSFSDEEILFGDKSPQMTADRFHNYGVEEVVVKQGDKGYWLSDRKRKRHISIREAPQVVDSSGAGDAFNGVYLAARLEGQTPEEASYKAARVAAIVVSQRGAIIQF